MLAKLKSARYPVELGLLLGLCFFLPLLEAPKNLLWLAYVATWLVNRARARDFGGRWDRWDTLIAAWIGSGFLVALFAGVDGQEWRGAGDLARYGSVLWCVKRAGYSEHEQRWVLGVLVSSTVIGLAAGYIRLWSGIGKSGYLQLHSVGHVNHTAIYIAIMLGVCASWLFARWRAWRANTRLVAVAVFSLVLVSLIVTTSRGAIGVGLVALLGLGVAWWPRWRVPALASVVVVAAVAAVTYGGRAEVVVKHETNVAAQNVLAFRDGVWRMALATWKAHPLFGVGMDNYSRVRVESLPPGEYHPTSHAHSLYFNTLAERGVVGAAALAAVLIAWGVQLLVFWWRRPASDHDWLLWGAAAGALAVSAGTGLANTTLHHEHGLLATLLLGLWLSRLPARRAS
jgi:O-antigen ligase